MSCAVPPHISREQWDTVPAIVQDLALQARELMRAGTLESQVAALEMCPFWLLADLFGAERSNERSFYMHLDDESFANFRMVRTPGVAAGVLYRSSSPLWPGVGRNAQADAAAQRAGVATVFDLANERAVEERWPNARERFCLQQDIRFFRMNMFFTSADQRALLAQLLRTMGRTAGPYLIFCMEGQDRTGYVCALLEAFMGASLDCIAADYLATYENYYGISPDGEGARALTRYFFNQLRDAFEVDSLEDAVAAVGLQALAESFFQSLGLSAGECAALRNALGGGAASAATDAASAAPVCS